jgi:hypothetical protein
MSEKPEWVKRHNRNATLKAIGGDTTLTSKLCLLCSLVVAGMVGGCSKPHHSATAGASVSSQAQIDPRSPIPDTAGGKTGPSGVTLGLDGRLHADGTYCEQTSYHVPYVIECKEFNIVVKP